MSTNDLLAAVVFMSLTTTIFLQNIVDNVITDDCPNSKATYNEAKIKRINLNRSKS